MAQANAVSGDFSMEDILRSIVDRIDKAVSPLKIILFGSRARGDFNKNSDFDLVVVLRERGMSGNYREMLKKRLKVTEPLIELRSLYPVDVLVYTADEWLKLESENSALYCKLASEGKLLKNEEID